MKKSRKDAAANITSTILENRRRASPPRVNKESIQDNQYTTNKSILDAKREGAGRTNG